MWLLSYYLHCCPIIPLRASCLFCYAEMIYSPIGEGEKDVVVLVYAMIQGNVHISGGSYIQRIDQEIERLSTHVQFA